MGKSVFFSFSLDADKDARLIRYLRGLPKGQRSAVLRKALEVHIGGNLTHADLAHELQEVKRLVQGVDRKLEQGVTLGGAVEPVDDDPDLAEAYANLAKLGV